MNKLEYKKGLLYTSIELKYKEKSIIIDDVIIDTGASHTIIATEYLEEMDIPLLDDDEMDLFNHI
jgi:predicted aspartyl protease